MESMLGQTFGGHYAAQVAAMQNVNPPKIEKNRLVDVLQQTSGCLSELEKLLFQIQQTISGPVVMPNNKAEEKLRDPVGSLHIATSNRNDVHRLQNIAQAILNDL